MIENHKVALLQCPHYTDAVEELTTKVYQVQSAKDLIRVLIEKEVDLILTNDQNLTPSQCEKIFNTYHVPFLQVDAKQNQAAKTSCCVGSIENPSELGASIQRVAERIARLREKRRSDHAEYLLQQVINFTNRVLHTTKDDFISDVKSFSMQSHKMESSHWVSVRSQSSKLPAILKLKQELENQKVDQGGLIKDLDSCSVEVMNTDEVQIWKTRDGDYICMLWVHESESNSQCLILNKVQIRKRLDFEALMLTLVPFLKRRWSLCQAVGEAQQQVYRDSLTSLYNQKFLEEVVGRKIEEYKRYETPFSILFIDVDHFKRVNDSLGHVVGSGVLKKMAVLLKDQIRASDFAFRYGGDEFIILLSQTEGEDAVNVAERIRKEVENSQFIVNGLKVRITVSIGLAFFPVHADSAEDIIRIADEAMYYGKHKSRNIVYKAS